MISLSHLQNLIKKYFSQRNLIICLTLGSSLFLITSLTRKINRSIVNRKYHQTISKLHTQRNNECEAFIAKYSNTIAKELQQKILSYSFVELSEKLCSNELSSVEIYLTYAFRAASLGRSLKLIADIDLESGLKQAELRDLERKKDPKKCSSIHGLPISVKDHITCKGLKTTLGYVCNADNERWDHDCCLIDLLRNKGAIIFTHSNIPQGLISCDSSNNIWGESKNPWDVSRTPGGSSGGEAGLIASRCSPLGFGSDLAGSIRIPAAFSGIYSFKPTAFRMSFDGVMGLENNEKFTFREFNWVLGPLGKCVDDLALILNEIYGQFKRDCRNCPLPFNKTQYNEYSNTSKKLKIAYILDDEYCEVCPAVKNCLQEVVKKLEGLGHQMIEFPWKNFKEFIIYGYVHFGAGETLSHKIMRVGKGEYPHKMLLSNTAADKFPSFVKKILIKLMAKMGEKRVSEVLDVFIKAENPNFLDKCSEEKDKMKNKFYKLWLEEDFDAIISPVTPFPAVPLGLGPQLTILFPFTIMYNILEMPSGVVPIRKIRKDEEFYVSKHKDSKTEALKKIMVKSEGLPVAIQVGALPFKDEVALGLMKQIERIFNFHEHPENI